MNDPHQIVYNIAEICAAQEICNAIISPGSRSAPLALAFARHPRFSCQVIVDERSAAFVALGQAQFTRRPVVLVCTSGTAALNYAPAVAEAYYQGVPLLIFTADRPPEWIDQHDGQTIVQRNLYGANVLAYMEMPVETGHPDAKWQVGRSLAEAIHLCQSPVPGPVHINVPLREPLYPSGDIAFGEGSKRIHRAESCQHLAEGAWDDLIAEWHGSQRRLLVAGLLHPRADNWPGLSELLREGTAMLLADIVSNLHQPGGIDHFDMVLGSENVALLESLSPDLLITFGGPVVSKHLKLFLRKFPAERHWHLSVGPKLRDPFQSLRRVINSAPDQFFGELSRRVTRGAGGADFCKNWKAGEETSTARLHEFLSRATWSELLAMQTVLQALPPHSVLHLGNSSIVRLANFISLKNTKDLSVFSNRGTSGIDGTLSTAVGAASVSDQLTTILIGDLAFFYDRNALWQRRLPSNMRVIVFNNHGGGIFRILEGSRELAELDAFFEVGHKLSAKNAAAEHGLNYSYCDSARELDSVLNQFFCEADRAGILELDFHKMANAETFLEFKSMMREIT